MRVGLRSVFLVAAGVVLGALLALSLRAPALEEPAPLRPPSEPRAIQEVPLPRQQRQVLLVWTPTALPTGLRQQLAAVPGVDTVTTVNAGTVDLVASRSASGQPIDVFERGWSVPLDTFAVQRRSYAAMLPPSASAAIRTLRTGTVVLGETSARVRGVAVGDVLRVRGGRTFRVAAILDDSVVGGAELLLTRRDGRALGITTPRFALVRYAGSRAARERAIRGLVPKGTTARIRGPGETPFLRHGDAVLPQALLKEAFGEFQYRVPQGARRDFEQDPDWVRDHIVRAKVPLLGTIQCHRGVMPMVRGALSELAQEGLGHLIDADQFAGCWNPRLISQGGAVSRHAWGIAVDVNAVTNPTGQSTAQDPRLVRVMQRWGFTWGGFWLVPDPMHFEYAGPPS